MKRQLQLLGFSAATITALLHRGVPDPILTLAAPISGAISVRQAIPGAMVEAAEKLVELMDTSVVWVEGEVVEPLLTAVRTGQQARVRVAAYPETVFTGTRPYRWTHRRPRQAYRAPLDSRSAIPRAACCPKCLRT